MVSLFLPLRKYSPIVLQIINLSSYRFTPLDHLEELKAKLKSRCLDLGIKGLILLATEGINFSLSGTRPQLDSLLQLIRSIPGLTEISPKESPGSTQPFQRLLVKIKKEIVRFGVPGVDPALHPAPKISPTQLKQWLDDKHPITLLDVRNQYEIRMGTFQGAIDPHISNFRDFPQAVQKLHPSLKTQPLVMFCTGGIRCEKAGAFMEMQGFKNIFQLDGGILKYFEDAGGAHYQGECFVFDERVGVDTKLQETDSVLCYNCEMPLLASDLAHPHYAYEKSCHHCFHGKPQGRGNTKATQPPTPPSLT
jgi:UPF0176 protein